MTGLPAEPQLLLHITHARQDEAWVEGVLIPALGLIDGQYWTRAEDHPGKPKLDELARAVESCRYTLLVASSAARVDQWAQFAGVLAQHLGIEEEHLRRTHSAQLGNACSTLAAALWEIGGEPGRERARALAREARAAWTARIAEQREDPLYAVSVQLTERKQRALAEWIATHR